LRPAAFPASETSVEKERLLLQEGNILTHDRTENHIIPGPVER